MNLEQRADSRTPTLHTERLTLRAHRTADLASCAQMWADPAVVRHMGGTPSTPQQTWLRVLAYAGHWSLLGFGYWAVADRTTDAYLGDIGFADFKRDISPAMNGFPELGWSLGPQAWGRGLATEGALAACAWADEHFPGSRTTCIIAPANVASLGVARKLGYAIFDRRPVREADTFLLARERAQPEAAEDRR